MKHCSFHSETVFSFVGGGEVAIVESKYKVDMSGLGVNNVKVKTNRKLKLKKNIGVCWYSVEKKCPSEVYVHSLVGHQHLEYE